MFRFTYTIHPDDEDELVANLSEHDLSGISQYNRDDGLVDFEVWFTTRQAAEHAQATITPPPNDTLAHGVSRGISRTLSGPAFLMDWPRFRRTPPR